MWVTNKYFSKVIIITTGSHKHCEAGARSGIYACSVAVRSAARLAGAENHVKFGSQTPVPESEMSAGIKITKRK
jgi:hypothetical protein